MSLMQMSDQELIKSYLKGSEKAFEILLSRTEKKFIPLFIYLSRIEI